MSCDFAFTVKQQGIFLMHIAEHTIEHKLKQVMKVILVLQHLLQVSLVHMYSKTDRAGCGRASQDLLC